MSTSQKYVANYFLVAKAIIDKHKPDAIVTMQFFQRKAKAILCGINEVLRFLEANTDTSKYSIKYLPEGSHIQALEPVLELEGHYRDFGIYEGVIDGILARSTSIATNAYECKIAAGGKNIIYMGDRGDHYLNQEIDGHAVEVGGLTGHSTMAGSRGNADVIFGSIPHALIQHFGGDLVAAMQAYRDVFPHEKALFALVDFNNDVIGDALKVLQVFGSQLAGVRVDTAKNMVDKMFANEPPQFGVNVTQIKRLRAALDQHGGRHVQIVVSSGFTPEKISAFEAQQAPVDAYGVGDFILKVNIGFTCDAVKHNGQPIAKVGRTYRLNPRLIQY